MDERTVHLYNNTWGFFLYVRKNQENKIQNTNKKNRIVHF